MAYARRVTRARASARTRAHLGSIRFLALSTLGILVAHDTIFVAQYGIGSGYEAAMAQTGHGYWPAFVLFSLLLGGVGALSRRTSAVQARPQGAWPAGRRRPLGADRPIGPRSAACGRGCSRSCSSASSSRRTSSMSSRVVAGRACGSCPHPTTRSPSLRSSWSRACWPPPGAGCSGGGDVLIERLRAAHAAVLAHRRHADRAPHRRWALLAALLANRWALLRRDAERAPPLTSAA